jgi:hypothetical protein
MAVTCSVQEAYGATPTVATASALNFLVVDAASGANTTTEPGDHPIPIPESNYWYSFERWFYLLFAGNSNAITSIYVWKSAGTYNTGYAVYANVKTPNPTTYVQSDGNKATQSSFATGAIPTTQGGGLTPAYNASGTKSDYIIAQLRVAAGATPGPMIDSTATPPDNVFTISYQYNTTG